jgi:DNA-packaging protein gp3
MPEKKNKGRPSKPNSGQFQPGNQASVGNNGGAPVIYSDEWIANEAREFREWLQKPDSLFFTTFATDRGYCIQRLTEFADKSSEFSEVLKYAKDVQHNRLVNCGLKNETNCQITKFVLANHHGYTDKQQVSGDASSPLGFILKKDDGNSKDLVNGNNRGN